MKMSFVFSFFDLFQLSQDNCAAVQPEREGWITYLCLWLYLLFCFYTVLCARPQESLHLSNTQSCSLHLFSTTLIPPCCISSPTSAPLLPSSFPPSLHYLILSFLTRAYFICYPTFCLPPTSSLFLLSLLPLLRSGSDCSDSSLTASVDHHQLSSPLLQ